ncbi:MAG: hypothetical protein JWN34_2359 [Bryobacterales bacterium]|nr:hypothetical protein [Bryobacterales bacterium]
MDHGIGSGCGRRLFDRVTHQSRFDQTPGQIAMAWPIAEIVRYRLEQQLTSGLESLNCFDLGNETGR